MCQGGVFLCNEDSDFPLRLEFALRSGGSNLPCVGNCGWTATFTTPGRAGKYCAGPHKLHQAQLTCTMARTGIYTHALSRINNQTASAALNMLMDCFTSLPRQRNKSRKHKQLKCRLDVGLRTFWQHIQDISFLNSCQLSNTITFYCWTYTN